MGREAQALDVPHVIRRIPIGITDFSFVFGVISDEKCPEMSLETSIKKGF